MTAARPSQKVQLPRALLLWWSGWLLCSWAICFGLRGWIMPSTATFATASQRLLFNMMLGISLVWPLYRLVGRRPGAPRLLALVDWITIFVTLQVALWPLRIPAQWPLERVALIDASIWSWGLVISAIIALGAFFGHPAWRLVAMGACVLLCVLAPTVAVLVAWAPKTNPLASALMEWSPLSALWRYTGTYPLHTLGDEWTRIAVVTTAGIMAWIGVMLIPARPNRRAADHVLPPAAAGAQR